MSAGSIIVSSDGDRKMAANMANSSLPNEEDFSSLVLRVYRTVTEEVPRHGSVEVTPAMLKKSCREMFEFNKKRCLCITEMIQVTLVHVKYSTIIYKINFMFKYQVGISDSPCLNNYDATKYCT